MRLPPTAPAARVTASCSSPASAARRATTAGPRRYRPSASATRPTRSASFSYAADGGPYTKGDTYAPLLTSARRLADQLRAQQRTDPGREVDLIAHSQGGVVVLAFLKLVYDPADATYPPLGKVITLSSPLQGAPLATLADEIRDFPGPVPRG